MERINRLGHGNSGADGLSPLHAQRAASEGWEGSRQTILLARRTRTMKRCSSDARSEGQSGDSLRRGSVKLQRRQQETLVRANGTSRRASGVGRVRKSRAVGDSSRPLLVEIVDDWGWVVENDGHFEHPVRLASGRVHELVGFHSIRRSKT
jgi:hypothetical protein